MDSGEGNKSEETLKAEREDSRVERMEKATAERNDLLDREEAREAAETIAGTAEAGQPPKKPEVLSDIDYAKKVALGAANPLVEDGFN